MKRLLLLLITLSCFTFLSSASYEDLAIPFPIIKTSTLTVSLTSIEQKAFFKRANYDERKDNLEFEATEKIKYIQIFNNEGKLKYQIPVMSHSVFISRRLFKSGSYQLGFMLEGNPKIQFTNVEVN